MICEGARRLPDSPKQCTWSVQGRQGRPPAGPARGAQHSHALTHSHTLPRRTHHHSGCGSGGQAGTFALTHYHTHPQPTHIYVFCPEKSVNKASLAPNEAFLPDFFGSIKQTVASLIKAQIVIGQKQSCDSQFGPISTLSP